MIDTARRTGLWTTTLASTFTLPACRWTDAEWRSSAARRAHIPQVIGSNPDLRYHPDQPVIPADALLEAAPLLDWSTIPVQLVPVGRFVLCLNGITPATLAMTEQDAPVLAMARGPVGDVQVINGRHRVLRSLLRGDAHVPARVLPIP